LQGFSTPPPSRAAFVFIFITVLLDMLALGIIVPVLPGLVVFFRGGDTVSAAAIYGVFASVWAAMQFIFSPILGSLSDRFGRRKVILLSNVGLGLDYLLMAVAPTLGWLFVGRVASGITSSSFPTAIAYIADVTPPNSVCLAPRSGPASSSDRPSADCCPPTACARRSGALRS
jgi:DHA1 family tetracycline resistance protein-like MFS transporter